MVTLWFEDEDRQIHFRKLYFIDGFVAPGSIHIIYALQYPLDGFRPYRYVYSADQPPLNQVSEETEEEQGSDSSDAPRTRRRRGSSSAEVPRPSWSPVEADEFESLPEYKLAGLVEHSGRGIDRGHYIAFCRDPFPRDGM
jgi:hypothetical protein